MTVRVIMIEPMGRGGVAHYTFRLCEALSEQGVHCALITSTDFELDGLPRRFRLYRILPEWGVPGLPSSLAPTGGPATRWRRRWRSLMNLCKMVSIVLIEQAGVIHAQWISSPHDSKLFSLLKLLRKQVVYTAHNVLPHEPQQDDRLLRRYLSRVDQVIVHSHDSLYRFGRTFPEMLIPVHVVPMGDHDVFPHDSSSKEEARTYLGLPPAGPIVLFFGGIREYKGLMDLIRAFQIVDREISGVRLLIAGALFEDFEPYASLIRVLGVSDRVICRLGYQPLEQVPRLFRAADVVAVPYRRASQSGVIQIAFGLRVPVVATRAGGIPETLDDGRAGLLVEPGDVPELASAIIRLLRDRVLADRLVDHAHAILSTKHSWAQIARRTSEIYRQAQADGHGRHA